MLWFVRSLYQNLPQMGQNVYHNMLVPFHDSIPSFMNFRRVWDLLEFQNQVSERLRPSHDAELFEIQSNFLHGTEACTHGHIYDFTAHFGALEHVHVVQI